MYLTTLLQTPSSRATTHLSLRTVTPTLYTAFPKHWLETLLQRLPRLRSLDLSSWPLLDHAACCAVSRPSNLRSLTARGCANLTVGGLVNLLEHLPCLEEVDFCGTKVAAATAVVAAMAGLPLVRVLARDVGLADGALEVLAKGLGTRVREVDVGCDGVNAGRVGERGVEALLGYCFAPPVYDTAAVGATAGAAAGLTKVGVSGNKLSSRSVQTLLRTTRLTSLDVGPLESVDGIMAAVRIYAAANLDYLRIDWRVVLDPAFLGVGKLVLVNVPAFASPRAARGIAGVVGTEGVRVLELEMEVGDDGSGDFSFFEEEAGGREREERGDVDVLSSVAKRKREIGWRGRVRVVRDLAGGESTERGVSGEMWGVVREGV
ncbi:unnamed protein product [Tuber aestivum]|uniref:F-box domain-containing protein n=1 Tax=Tuber aestivum TaxID=59557 RepID=A0A292PTL3_9PEZI|nr:unnamed protein product [Tuber aestivum]